MSTTNYYWQGGRKLEIEQAPNAVTVHAEEIAAAERAATASNVPVRNVRQVGPGLVRFEVIEGRDTAMDELRQDHVVHHVYHTKDQPDDEVLITDSFFLRFRPETSRERIENYLTREGLAIQRRFSDGSLLVQVTDATGRNPIAAANSAALQADVEYAEPNLVRNLIRFQFLPPDPLFIHQWHLHAPADGTDLLAGADIGAPEAWDTTLGTRDVVIAVADDGFDVSHPDFSGTGKIAGTMNVSSNGFQLSIDDDVTPRPGDYHGTPCAGVAVAEANGLGTLGVAPGCSLLAVRFPLSLSDAHLAEMFERISPLADVVSCSWGYGPANAPMATTLRDVITHLASSGGRRGRGLVICVAAGNNNCPVQDLDNATPYEFLDAQSIRRVYSGPIDRWIAAHPDVITVAACTSLKDRAAYSSWGSEINICAPSNNFDDLHRFTPRGRGIFTLDNEGFGFGSDFDANSRYTGRFGGTSSATPTVAGVCGLVISANTALSASEVRSLVESTASKDLAIASETPVNVSGDFDADGFSQWFGHGRVDAAAAVNGALPSTEHDIDAEAEDVPIHIPDTSQPVSSTIELDHDGVIAEIRVEVKIRHSFIGDLRVDLIAPDGTTVNLQNHAGGSNRNLDASYSAADVPALAALAGRSVRGAWRLRIVDTWFWDQGHLEGWRLAIRAATPGFPNPAVNLEQETERGTY